MKSLLTAVGLFVSLLGFTQRNILTGVITDVETKEPVAFANVFFANTRIGESSGADGKFSLTGFPSGKYDLTVTFVGYTTYQQSLEFNGSEFKLTIELVQNEIKLNEIVVNEDTTGWAQNFAIFKRGFLGETENANQCKILNPEKIHLFFDRNSNMLVAHAREPIQIENRALGFKIDYYLYIFEMDFRSGKLIFFGVPAFQNLTSERKLVLNRWEKERLRAYNGSVTHFIRALRSDSLRQQGFELRKFYRVPNPERPSQEFLNAKINESRTKNARRDSLDYYLNLRAKPELIDSVGRILLSGSEILNSEHEVVYKGMLKVDFKNEKEEVGYLRTVGRTAVKWQSSIMTLMAPTLKLYENGYYEDIRDVYVENYWAWSEKMADMLPYDYKPELNKRKRK